MAVRKTVTVLFCDLAASTELGERLDPERLRELLGRWYEAMRGPLERHGGEVEKFIGDAVMAVFGLPSAHEDDALRAVRAAVEMRAAVDALNEELGGPGLPRLEVRIGVNTGEVVAGDEAETLVSGDAVNTAKRLEQAAAPGDVLVGPATRRLVENAVELEPVEPLAAKGKREPLEAWRVLGTIPGASAFARRLDAPLVGRERELAELRRIVAEAERERACRLVTVLGPAGIGKSRLAAELGAGLSARCLPYGDGISLLPLTELLRSAGGAEGVLRAVEREADGDLIADRLCSETGSAEELQWAVRRLLETLARERTVVVCVEDVHWAQPAFLDLLEYVEGWSRDAPIVLLCLARPELLDARPRWPGATITLAPLSERHAAELLDALADEWPLDAAARAQIAEAAEGNPLFLEQMVAMLADGGGMRELPPTIQALLAARLDALAPGERTALERASVIGRDFSRAALAALAGEDDTATLLALVRKELLRPADSPFAGDDGFRFRHALIRDAAYNAMPKRVRAEMHERAADWLAEHGAEDELVGYHLEQSHRFLAELGRRSEPLALRAGELLGTAGVRAAARGDAAAARTLLSRALALLPARHELRVELLRELSSALWLTGDLDAAELALSDSIDSARTLGDVRREWYGRLERAARSAVAQGDTDALVRTAERAVEVFEELGDSLGLARAWRRLALVSHTHRRYAEGAAHAERALRHAEQSGDEQERARAADVLCTLLLYGPTHVDPAIERASAILAAAGTNLVLRAHVSTSLGALHAMRGDFDRSRELLAPAGETYDALGLRLPHVGWMQVSAETELLAGDSSAAQRLFRSAYELVDDGGHDSLATKFASMLALALARDGEADAARTFARVCARAHAIDAESLARLRAAQALLVAEAGSSLALADEAVEIADAGDDLTLQAAMRLVRARVAHDPEEAARARELYERKGNLAAAASTGLWSLQP
ncbi:MAG TPA: adenylate/guanylate cyclase domain-containing protein [Gaiellaceae bacterium]|nr:adenylate/guanylate cyclase domain-containing protein [Gaiellaceae bacterium]